MSITTLHERPLPIPDGDPASLKTGATEWQSQAELLGEASARILTIQRAIDEMEGSAAEAVVARLKETTDRVLRLSVVLEVAATALNKFSEVLYDGRTKATEAQGEDEQAHEEYQRNQFSIQGVQASLLTCSAKQRPGLETSQDQFFNRGSCLAADEAEAFGKWKDACNTVEAYAIETAWKLEGIDDGPAALPIIHIGDGVSMAGVSHTFILGSVLDGGPLLPERRSRPLWKVKFLRKFSA